jgi:TonB family protein
MRRFAALSVVVTLPLVLSAGPAADAQETPRSPSEKGAAESPQGEAVVPPTLRTHEEAVYPPEALRDQRVGTVGLELEVSSRGTVTSARITAPAGHGFDEAALEAVRKFTFEPAKRNGVAIPSAVQFAYEFHLPAPAAPPTRPEAAHPEAATPAAPPPPTASNDIQAAPGGSTLVIAQRPLNPPPEVTAASDSTTSQRELALRPRFRPEALLEVVPGVFSVQHAGGGKAQQDFVRGFNLDHGTDLAVFIEDAPLNLVSHAHGQGWTDYHSIIPETVARIDSAKGTYAADVGDFGTAGSIHFRMADHVDESIAKLELAPTTGHERLVVVESPDLGAKWRMVVATEVFHENGPFIHPEDFGRLNGYAKVTRQFDERSELSLLTTVYSGSWNMSGVLPARAVCGESDGTPTPAAYAGNHCINRFDSVDPTQGGASQRFMAMVQYKNHFATNWDFLASPYILRSNLQLFPNDGIAAAFQPDGIKYGSQIEQDDSRTQMGIDVRLIRHAVLGGMKTRTTFGLQIRNDDIEAQLHRTVGRMRLDGVDSNIPGPIYDGHTNETESGIFLEEEVVPVPWLKLVLGARGDRVDVATNSEGQTAVDKTAGYGGGAQFSPKGSVVVSPLRAVDLFANYGRGFHTNDARTLSLGPAATLIAAASGYEIGTTIRPLDGLSLSAVGFLIDLTSELTIDGDTASTSPSGPTRRYGVELVGRYNWSDRLYADVAFTAAHGQFTDAADVAAGTVLLPDAPIRTFSAAIGGRQPIGPVTAIGSVTVRSLADRYGDQGPNPLIEPGWTIVNASLGARWNRYELLATLLNVGDVRWREGEFEVKSRLPGEGANPPAGISFTPGLPRTLMVHGAVYW